eukprot:GHVT01021061.1.p1 GENE.GHVT01021061.1~~GHVT01021061.1.p1  ORF type:complete len:256 (-),score=9.19 GHVT01021061.1:761-1528(-)
MHLPVRCKFDIGLVGRTPRVFYYFCQMCSMSSVVGLATLGVAIIFFIWGLDDDKDYLRIYHGCWHIFVSLFAYFMCKALNPACLVQKRRQWVKAYHKMYVGAGIASNDSPYATSTFGCNLDGVFSVLSFPRFRLAFETLWQQVARIHKQISAEKRKQTKSELFEDGGQEQQHSLFASRLDHGHAVMINRLRLGATEADDKIRFRISKDDEIQTSERGAAPALVVPKIDLAPGAMESRAGVCARVRHAEKRRASVS